jgi:hypothetical protein
MSKDIWERLWNLDYSQIFFAAAGTAIIGAVASIGDQVIKTESPAKIFDKAFPILISCIEHDDLMASFLIDQVYLINYGEYIINKSIFEDEIKKKPLVPIQDTVVQQYWENICIRIAKCLAAHQMFKMTGNRLSLEHYTVLIHEGETIIEYETIIESMCITVMPEFCFTKLKEIHKSILGQYTRLMQEMAPRPDE